jgi:hypothetical protein
VTWKLRKLLRKLSNQIQIAESAAECLSTAQANASLDLRRRIEELEKNIIVAAQIVHAMHNVVEHTERQIERD